MGSLHIHAVRTVRTRAVLLPVVAGLGCGPSTAVAPSTSPDAAPPIATATPDPSPGPTRSDIDIYAATTRPATPDPSPCDARVADVPTALFGERVLIRPPIGVELVEDNPTFATTFGGAISTCDVTIDRMSVLVYQAEPGKSARTILDGFVQMLGASGYDNGTFEEPLAESEHDIMVTAHFPASDGMPEARVLVRSTRLLDSFVVVFFQTQPSEWARISPSLVASAESLLAVP